ncbi:hypothetical protein SAMN06265365_122108 [Tistlia consotensis]|uniref:Uncharacterized protein n=1 Tax=Tistlia consotensis USBA 355 TaxID=560819 RepID=A0A1Y6CGZ4_9PROT|nr:hypothetical protein [Tistlia consotensis]SMF63425.1 hypothetical protein SAMN05428998_124108 [Tistlia consotensis USBA 355]SNR96197.1 hypothetical protein SAMN06265365_122108 [Tistlia consotensis]
MAADGTMDQQTQEAVRRSLEQGPADPVVVELERRIAEASRRQAPDYEINRVKEQLLARYFPSMIERGSRLAHDQFKSDVFLEVYNQRMIALSEELGRPHSREAAIAHLLLAGIYKERGEAERTRFHLSSLRRLLESARVDLEPLGQQVIDQMTAGVQVVARPY